MKVSLIVTLLLCLLAPSVADATLVEGEFSENENRPPWIGAEIYGFRTDTAVRYQPLGWGTGMWSDSSGSKGFEWFAYIANGVVQVQAATRLPELCPVPIFRILETPDQDGNPIIEEIFWGLVYNRYGTLLVSRPEYLAIRCRGDGAGCRVSTLLDRLADDLRLLSCVENPSVRVRDMWRTTNSNEGAE